MRRKLWLCLAPAALALVFASGAASAQVQTISATSNSSGVTPGNAIASTASKITCTQASGSNQGPTLCYVTSPGWNGTLSVGESIGTNGPGNVQLQCQGSYSVPFGGLRCTARVEPTACVATQNISASSSATSVTRGSAALATNATVRCQSVTGGTNMSCGIQSATGNVILAVGQQTFVPGPGTTSVQCGGSYSANGSLACTARVTQVCP